MIVNNPRRIVILASVCVLSFPVRVHASEHHHDYGGTRFPFGNMNATAQHFQPNRHNHGWSSVSFGAVSSGYSWFGPPYFMTLGPNGPVFMTPAGGMGMPVFVDGGALGGGMPPMNRIQNAPKARQPNPMRSDQLVTIGDRLFRAGNLKRAADRFEQAFREAPDRAAPRVHLAQVELTRGNYSGAAALLRSAIAAEPGWLPNAPDIQAIYGEPVEFARQIARLESRVLVEPGDRDAWLVLGAQLFLSGRTRRAGDIFLRLSDRQGDPALAAFLAAARPGDAAAR